MPEADGEVRKRLVKLRARLLLDEPFFGLLMLRLKLLEDPSCKTMWTDGVSLGYNADFAKVCDDQEIVGALAHEVMHVTNKHHIRRGQRDPDDWNDACDYAINPVLKQAGFHLPKGCLLDAQFAGKSAEFIYARIAKPKPQGQDASDASTSNDPQDDPQGSDDAGNDAGNDSTDPSKGSDPQDGSDGPDSSKGSGKPSKSGGKPSQGPADGASDDDGQGEAGQGGSKDPQQPAKPKPSKVGEVRDLPKDVSPEEHEQALNRAIAQAAQTAAARGLLPGNLQDLVQKAIEPRVDWKEALRRWIQQTWSADDYTWRRPNIRYVYQDLYLPTLHSENFPCLVAAIDASSSILSSALLGLFQEELRKLLEEVRPQEAWEVYCDAAIQAVHELQQGDPPVAKAAGGGGTSFVPVFDWVEKQGLAPTALIYLTDMMGEFPAQDPGYPVLWAYPKAYAHCAKEAPFGELLELDEDMA